MTLLERKQEILKEIKATEESAKHSKTVECYLFTLYYELDMIEDKIDIIAAVDDSYLIDADAILSTLLD